MLLWSLHGEVKRELHDAVDAAAGKYTFLDDYFLLCTFKHVRGNQRRGPHRGWHLNEARRLLADLDTPPSLAAAIRLDSWLRSEAQASGTDRVPTKRIYQYGPNCVRDSRDLRAALAILAERGRAWLEESDRHPARTLIGSKSSESSRGCRVGNSVFHVPGARRMTGARGVIVLAF
jgi:hypothetical protein